MYVDVSFSELIGKTLESVENKGDEEIVFTTMEGEVYKLFHTQDCCESVTIEDICGDLKDLVDSVIMFAEEVENEQDVNPEGVPVQEYRDSFTWTFYKIDTAKGGVTIRWYGESNGYYSESVDFCKVA